MIPLTTEKYYVLCGVCSVVHQQELDFLDVADEESLVAGGHHVAGLLVGAIANLSIAYPSAKIFVLTR